MSLFTTVPVPAILEPRRRIELECLISPFLFGLLPLEPDALPAMTTFVHEQGFSDRLSQQCFRRFPCFSNRARRSSSGLKAALVLLHVVFAGVLFLFDTDLTKKTREEPWSTAAYLLLFLATLIQYYIMASSSPGFVIDAMTAGDGSRSTYQRQPASQSGTFISSTKNDQLDSHTSQLNSSSSLKLVMDFYPPGSYIRTWTCSYCNVIQSPRSKHCHDCGKCVLRYDHHCVWLGTCIGKGNHCRFWWYVFVETFLCSWTGVLYITFLRSNIMKIWWKVMIVAIFFIGLLFCLIFLLMLLLFHSYLVLTNQTTYELVRRRRVLYLRGIPESVRPFSRGVFRNLYDFYCSCDGVYASETVPNLEDLEARSRPCICTDVVICRCC